MIATGAAPRLLPAVPRGLPGVHTLRTVDDALALRDDLAAGPRVVVIGGGFIGTEVASSCRALGLDTTVVSAEPVLARQLGPLAEAAGRRLTAHGVTVITPGTVAAVRGTTRVEAVVLGDGREVPADVLVVAVGAVPATGWLEGSGARLDGGVICDASLGAVGLTHVVAAGDVARWPHPALGGELIRLEHWTNAGDQAETAAARLLRGAAAAPCTPVPSFWSDQFGVRIQGVGFTGAADEAQVVTGDPAGGHFVAEYRRRGELVGAVTAGAPRALIGYRRLLSPARPRPTATTGG